MTTSAGPVDIAMVGRSHKPAPSLAEREPVICPRPHFTADDDEVPTMVRLSMRRSDLGTLMPVAAGVMLIVLVAR
jgi:hypothetical protein